MTNKLVVIIKRLKLPKIKKILLYEMKFFVPNYICLQNPWLGGYRSQMPVLSVLCPQLNLLTPHRTKFLGKPLSGPEVSRKLSFPDFMTTAQEGGKVDSLRHRPHLPPRKSSWYSFLLQAESTPGPQCDRKDYVNEKFQWHHRGSNQQPSDL